MSLPGRTSRRRSTRAALSLLAAAILLALPSIARGQVRKPAEPRRPKFQVVRDTNSAGAYYYHGLSVIDRNPQEAADAFYWASRLDPDWADPYFARRVALHLTNPHGLDDYLDGDSRVRSSPERRRADSLSRRAFLIDPFLYRRLERRLVDEMLEDARREYSREYAARNGEDPGLLPVRLNPVELANRNPRLAGWVAYTDGKFADALHYFADAIKHDPKAYDLHSERADVFYLVTQYDSALAELQVMLDAMRKLDDKKLIPFYDSKAMFEYEVGRVHVMRGDLAAARAAYGRALTEDMSFYMAHAAIGDVALAQRDTAAALAEYAQAVDIAADEPGLRYKYGVALFNAMKYEDAAEQFRQAIALDPYFAKPYYPLAYILEGTGKDSAAVASYEGFLQRAPAADSTVAGEVRKRLTELRSVSASTATRH
ncbi:MAG TPA: tetratricopeptide repeat protein [Gemmatimonadaceae bacterium]|nr:tetratricopeptide repeat protein [Gemmatimonadaceae bacterium]